MPYIDNAIFFVCLVFGVVFFVRGLKQIYRNIRLGKPINRMNRPAERWKLMLRVALGQSKMTANPIAGILHILVYVGFVIINLEMLEIVVDGLFGTHRFLVRILGDDIYNWFTGALEVLALLVLFSVVIFFIRRNVLNIARFKGGELSGWGKRDANWILMIEFALMLAFFMMNTADVILQARGEYPSFGYFPVSAGIFVPVFDNQSTLLLVLVERGAWWFHILGVLFFMNYLYYSKHLHILLAFPNTWYSDLNKKGTIDNMASVTREVKLMMNPDADPYSVSDTGGVPEKFGAEDVFDLNQIQLLNAYTCTECGRCSSACPAKITGKKLSPRKIMMSTRDRLEEVGRNINKNGKFVSDGKTLLDDYISREELWACTSCNACVEVCPVLINPLSIIIDMRRFLVMEQSAAPQQLNMMMANIENNAAPWQYSQSDRLNWAKE